MSSHPIILSIKSKLIVESKGTNTSLSAFALFRKAAAAKPGKGIDYNGFIMALKHFNIKAKEEHAMEAYHIMKGGSLRNSIKSRMGQYKSKYVVSTYDPEIHNLIY